MLPSCVQRHVQAPSVQLVALGSVLIFCARVGVDLRLLLHTLQIGEFFEGIEPGQSCYKVNAYLHHHYPDDWISSI